MHYNKEKSYLNKENTGFICEWATHENQIERQSFQQL